MTAILVDDEAQSHQVLTMLLERDHPDIVITASAYSVEEAYQLIDIHRPELVFLDIEMPDGLGFDLLEKFNNPAFSVIFITGFDKYARTAVKFGAVDYLLKPVNREELSAALKTARRKKIENQQIEIILETYRNLKQQQLPTRIGIATTEGIHYKLVKDIIRLEAQQNYTAFTLTGAKRSLLASKNIGEYEEQFEPYREFMRVHRSHLVNLAFVGTFVKSDGGYLQLMDGSEISVSRLYKDRVLARLGEL